MAYYNSLKTYKVNWNFSFSDYKLCCRISHCKVQNINDKINLHAIQSCIFCMSTMSYLNFWQNRENLKLWKDLVPNSLFFSGMNKFKYYMNQVTLMIELYFAYSHAIGPSTLVHKNGSEVRVYDACTLYYFNSFRPKLFIDVFYREKFYIVTSQIPTTAS